jgi:hypothetical protein
MKVDGACHCGFITIEAEVDPEKAIVCHCTDCQSGTGSAFRISIPAASNSVKITGEPASYVRTAASGNRRAQAFCPKCGSPVYSTAPGDAPKEFYMLRVGILRQRDRLVPKQQIWFRSALPWIGGLADLPTSETQQGTSHLR